MRSRLFLLRAFSWKRPNILFLVNVHRLFFASSFLFIASPIVAEQIPAKQIPAKQIPAPIGTDASEVLDYTMPKFPPELIGAKMGDGEAVVVITIDDHGKVDDSLALEATNDAFANAAISAVSEWLFKPISAIAANSAMSSSAMSDATTSSPRREVLQFNFKRSGVVTTMTHSDAAKDAFVGTRGPEVRTVAWNALDSAPRPIKVDMPQLPLSTSAKREKTPLVINFVIDRQGHVRVPVIRGAADPALAKAVLSAVKTWRYTPPMQQKQAVAVEVTNALVFPDPIAQ